MGKKIQSGILLAAGVIAAVIGIAAGVAGILTFSGQTSRQGC